MSPAASLNDDFLFRSLMETMADSIYFKDRQGRLLCVSWKMARDLGYADPAELVGKTDVDLFGQEFAERTNAGRLKSHGDGPTAHRPDGEPPARERPGQLDPDEQDAAP